MKQLNQYTISILGSMEGVAKSILSILHHSAKNKNDSLHHVITKCSICGYCEFNLR
jgi:predicted molibdopterin-dependent oxidoreductase YjgC